MPEIFSLIVFIAGFYPLAKRVGAHAQLWILGWGFFLLHDAARLFTPQNLTLRACENLISLWAIELCSLLFVYVTANTPTRRLGRRVACCIALPMLLQAITAAFPQPSYFALSVMVLFLLPGAVLLLNPRYRSRSAIIVASALALAAAALTPQQLYNPVVVANCIQSLLCCLAAYLYLVSAHRFNRGDIAAIAGLIGWGLSYPLVLLVEWSSPGSTIDSAFLALPRYLVVAGIIVTLLEEHVERTERLAMHDPLTDLPNRRMFEQRLIETMEEARLTRTTIACLVIDVDNFKTINDTLGHEAGDQLLRSLAVRLSWHMSPRDILARTGGDEFTALLAGVTDEHHLRFIASAMMSAGSVPIIIDNKPVDLRISIGIALSPDHADDIDTLRRAADAAMYTAKRRGGSNLAFADED